MLPSKISRFFLYLHCPFDKFILNYCLAVIRDRSTLRTISIEKEALKRRIQTDTQTTIKCTKIRTDGKRKRVLEIKGITHNDVYCARQQIKAINGNDDGAAKQSQQPTHFTCVKITDSTIKSNFSKLKVCRDNWHFVAPN